MSDLFPKRGFFTAKQWRKKVEEGYCPAREDVTHCNHWWDGDPCHNCGDNGYSPNDDRPAVGQKRGKKPQRRK